MTEGFVARFSPPVVPFGADQTVFVVVENSGVRGSVDREVERADLETIVADLLAGQFADPVRVLAFNTLEHWSKDLSADVAREIETRCDIDGVPVPDHLKEFVEEQGAMAPA
jgi:hypothetical protein